MQVGRIAVYTIMGLIMGMVGKVISLAGFQQQLSIVSGILLIVVTLLFLIPSKWNAIQMGSNNLIQRFRSSLSNILSKKSKWNDLYFGMLNGLLPCGLVYFALSASLAAGNIVMSALYMLVFGLFTSPLLLFVVFVLNQIQYKFKFQFNKIIPVVMITMGVLLILRGSNLNIPYLSPDMHACAQGKSCCHK